jgi:flavin-dependent dehydrogenase
MNMHYATGQEVALESGLHVSREILDAAMVQGARDAGAEVRMSTVCTGVRDLSGHWRVSLGRHSVDARFVVDASGSSRCLLRALGITEHLLSERLTVNSWYSARNLPGHSANFTLSPYGWLWESPVDGSRQVTCVMSFPGETHQMLTPAFGSVRREVTWRIASVVSGGNFAITGDSSAQIDPAAANGIERAVQSGIEAGLMAVRSWQGALSEEIALQYCRSVTARILQDCATLHHAYATRSGIEDPVGFGRLTREWRESNHGQSCTN